MRGAAGAVEVLRAPDDGVRGVAPAGGVQPHAWATVPELRWISENRPYELVFEDRTPFGRAVVPDV